MIKLKVEKVDLYSNILEKRDVNASVFTHNL